MEVICVIKNEKGEEWEETLEAKSLNTASADVKEIIDWFNSTLRPGESRREFVKILKEKTVAEKTKADKIKDFNSLLGDLRHEYSNGFGSVWLKGKFPLIMKAYERVLETGKSKVLNGHIQECFCALHDIPERLHYLKYENIVDLFKSLPNEGKDNSTV